MRRGNQRGAPQGRGDIKEVLEERRRELAEELARLTKPPEAGTNLSFGKRIGEGTTEAVERISSTAAARSIAASLADVDRALEKVGEGTYGRCDNCLRPIPAERLEAVPWASYCVECASGRGAGSPRPR
jgi:DnaK suppressor protein